MKIDFNKNNAEKQTIHLLSFQVDLIMRSLEMYCYIYRFAYPRRGKCESEEESLRISLVTDTYHQILEQYNYNSKFKNIFTEQVFNDLERRKIKNKKYRKIA